MKKYTSPVAEVEIFEAADIITSSFVTMSWSDFVAWSDVDDESGL